MKLFDKNSYVDAFSYITNLMEKNKVFEVTIKDKRSLTQNRYLHVCISLLAIELGYTVIEMKTHLKRRCPFMVYEKEGEKFLKETRSQTTKEQSDFVDWIRNYASINHNCRIPSPEEYRKDWVVIEKEIQRHKEYL